MAQFKGGQSNPTFLLTAGDGHLYVLRKKPPGQLLSSAHQVDREYRAMKALAGHIPVPVMRALCDDPEVIGTTFYVMDYLEGRIFRDATLPGLEPTERAAIWSTETPARMSAPAALRTWVPVRNVALARA